MATMKVVRGQLITFTATPKNHFEDPVTPDAVWLYLNYKHMDGATRTDSVEMQMQTDGKWVSEFDSKVAQVGPLWASLRAVNPPGSQDIAISITANAANPLPGP